MYNIRFDEKYKTLFYGKQKLMSISKLLRGFIPEFDKDGIAERYALKHNLIKQDVIDMWDKKAQLSRDKGTFIHKCIEKYFKDFELTNTINEELVSEKELESLYDLLGVYLKNFEIIGIEQAVGDIDYGLAGIYDCLMQNKKSKEYFLVDWKTNKEIKFKNDFNNFYAPLDYLPQANFIEYSLQLSLLNHCIKKDLNINITDMSFIHINEKINEYPVNFMKKEIDLILKTLK